MPLHEVRVSVWCAKNEAGIIESFFFFGGHEMMLLCYTHSVKKCECMTLKSVCGVLYVRLELLDLFF